MDEEGVAKLFWTIEGAENHCKIGNVEEFWVEIVTKQAAPPAPAKKRRLT